MRLARCVVEDGWPLRRADRYCDYGAAAMADRSSRPHHSPNRLPKRTEHRIIKVWILRRWGPARIAYLLGLNPATVHRVLRCYRMT